MCTLKNCLVVLQGENSQSLKIHLCDLWAFESSHDFNAATDKTITEQNHKYISEFGKQIGLKAQDMLSDFKLAGIATDYLVQ